MTVEFASTVRQRIGTADPPADVAVIVVTYRSAAFIVRCLRSVRTEAARAGLDCDVVVVDNHSPDDTVAVVEAEHPDVVVHRLPANTGFSFAVNLGIAATDSRHVLLLNPDAELCEGALAAMVDHLDRHGAVGAVAPQLRNPDGTDQRTARSFPTPAAALFGRRSLLTRLFPGNRLSKAYLNSDAPAAVGPARSVDWVSGACVMVPREVIARVGPLDTGYFMYWEDADWCRRIHDAGHDVRCLTDVEAVHAEGSCRQGWPPAQVRHFHRSAYRYYARHHLRGSRRVLRPAAAAAMTVRALALSVGWYAGRTRKPPPPPAEHSGVR